jgi:beta-lactamase regulating signal transducer with metallopeptidase domain
VTEHLLVSTAVLAIAMAAARFLPLTAHTRHAVLFCGLAKFAVPTAVLRFVPVEVIPTPLRTFGGGTASLPEPVAARIEWIPLLWAAIALLVFSRWLLLRARTVASALRSPAPASQRELDAVRDARRTMNLRVAVDAIRSPICEAPAVLRVVRPMIVLPARGCDELTDDELRSLVLHECAHIARRDNLGAIGQALATSLLWFHPLVWLASRALTVAREEACDEAVADAMHETGAYVSALTKICRAIVAPRTAGASCMASSKIRERMEHLMSYESIKAKAWSHRAMLAVGVVMIALSTFAVTPASKQRPYALTFKVTSLGNQMQYDIEVVDTATGTVVMAPRLTTQSGDVDATTTNKDGPEIEVHVMNAMSSEPMILLQVMKGGTLVQRTLYTHDEKTYDGEPVTLSLKDADLRDVLGTFGDLTGLTMDLAPDVQGKVTLKIANVPWDKVFDDILTERGFEAEVDGRTIHVRKK